MDNSKSGIEALLDDVDIFEVIVKELARRKFKRETAARAGKASGARYQRLRDLALEVYLDECANLLSADFNAQKMIANRASKEGLLNSLRPPFKIFERKFSEVVIKRFSPRISPRPAKTKPETKAYFSSLDLSARASFYQGVGQLIGLDND